MLGVYKYNNIGGTPSKLQDIEDMCQHQHKSLLNNRREFFSGTCFMCGALGSEVRIQRCAGCQLVSYCSKDCQKADWRQHKLLCKKFPVANGKNVIVRKVENVSQDNMKRGGAEYLNAVEELQNAVPMDMGWLAGANDVFMKARVCNVCFEARPENLLDCRCCTVSYCTDTHRLQDEHHRTQECDLLLGCAMANWYLTQYHQLQIPDGLLKEATLTDGLKLEKVSNIAKYSSEKWLGTIVNLINERLAFPLTIHHALKNLKLGEQREDVFEMTTLTIHIVHIRPMLDPRMWEFFLHQLPNLKKLHLTFISGIMELSNKYNSSLSVERCSDCKGKHRIITYNIQPVHYHEYFSSDDYVQPDVVAVFDCYEELMNTYTNIDRSHGVTTQRTMADSKHTVVILTNFVKDELEECVKSFHDAKPVKVLLPVQENPLCGISTFRDDKSYMNEKYHVCCLQGIQ